MYIRVRKLTRNFDPKPVQQKVTNLHRYVNCKINDADSITQNSILTESLTDTVPIRTSETNDSKITASQCHSVLSFSHITQGLIDTSKSCNLHDKCKYY